MARTTTIALREHVDEEVLLQVSRAMATSPLHRPPGFLDGPADEDEDEALFGDHDVRATDRGVFVQPPEECRSRRVDLRGPTDLNRGPVALPEADAHDGIVLRFDRARGGRTR